MDSERSITHILLQAANERLPVDAVVARIYPVLYDELRRLACAMMRDQKAGHTLQPTALVHEAYVRLVGQNALRAESRAQFFCLAAKAMRSVLVDHARRRLAAKRGRSWRRTTLAGPGIGVQDAAFEVIELDDALAKLATKNKRMAQVVELRIFGGMTAVAVAATLGVARRTVESDWKAAKAWLSSLMTSK
jgi:RNA polymerase sigma factor (TIGR02999 family)